MNIRQDSYFRRSYKRLHENQREIVNEAIRQIVANPELGEQKKMDLSGIRVWKFPLLDQQFLLGYAWEKDTLFLLALSVHENFYRDLKKHK